MALLVTLHSVAPWKGVHAQSNAHREWPVWEIMEEVGGRKSLRFDASTHVVAVSPYNAFTRKPNGGCHHRSNLACRTRLRAGGGGGGSEP